MEFNLEAFLFWPLAIALIISATAVILLRNPVSAALSLVLTIVFMAALFILLQAYYLAAIQILVYAGAVMVLFLFIIMLLDIQADKNQLITPLHLIGASLLTILSLILGYRAFASTPIWAQYFNLTLADRTPAGIKEIGLELFQKHMLPVQITALLLLAAAIGVVLLSKKEKADP
ncbi:MAG: NADH-quinone oxidoreductase subunit J [Methylacidiphilales bacterium]|nr:NADH-quinone oxidoreductase subunit J [Candidatus Methylacidiphilales bacterium]